MSAANDAARVPSVDAFEVGALENMSRERVPTEQLMRRGSLRGTGFVEWKKSRSRKSTSPTTGPS